MLKIESYKENDIQKRKKSEILLDKIKYKKKENRPINIILFPNKRIISNNALELTQFRKNSNNEITKENKYKDLSNEKSNTYRYLNVSMPEFKEKLNLKRFSFREKNKSLQETMNNRDKLIQSQSTIHTYRIPEKKNNFLNKDSKYKNSLLMKIKKAYMAKRFYKDVETVENAYLYKKRIKKINSSFSQESAYNYEKKMLKDLHDKNILFNSSLLNDEKSQKKSDWGRKKIIPKIRSKYLKEKPKYEFKELSFILTSDIKDFSEKLEKIGKESEIVIDKVVNSKFDTTFSLIDKMKFGKSYRSYDIYEKLKNIEKMHYIVNKRKIMNENVYKDYEQCLKIVSKEAERLNDNYVLNTLNQKKENKENKMNTKKPILEKFRRAIIKISNFIKQRKLNEEDIISFKIINTSFTYPETKSLINAIKHKDVDACDFIIEDKKYIVLDFDYFYLTPLHWAVKRNFYIFLPSLLDYGSKVDACSMTGETPLHYAVKNNYYDCAFILLFYLASPFIADKNGKKPIDITDDYDMSNLLDKVMKLHYSSVFRKTFIQDDYIRGGLWAFVKEEFKYKLKKEVFYYFNKKTIKDIFTLEN